jgi:hypothetical protein
VVAGLLVGLLVVAFRAVADRPVDLVLFSGQAELPLVVAEGSAGVLALLVLAKGLAYALSLSAGFRGGPVFPALVRRDRPPEPGGSPRDTGGDAAGHTDRLIGDVAIQSSVPRNSRQPSPSITTRALAAPSFVLMPAKKRADAKSTTART